MLEPQYNYDNYKSNYEKDLQNEKTIQDNSTNNMKVKLGILQKFLKDWDKYVYTVCILIHYINYGIIGFLGVPAMVDMKFLLHTTMVKLNYAGTINSIGYLCGSLCGFLYKFLNRQLVLALLAIINGIFFILQPLSQNVMQFYIFCFISSVGSGSWDSGNFVWIFEMWKDRSSSILNLQQMMYGVGTVIAPLLAAQYLVGDLSLTTSSTTSAIESTTLPYNNTQMNNTNIDDINYSVDRRSKLVVPYAIGGSLCLTMPIIFLVMFCIKRYKFSENQENNNNSIEGQTEFRPRTKNWLILFFALNIMVYSAVEGTFINFAATYCQYLPITIPAQTSAQLMSIMSTTYTVGRGASAFISLKLSPEIMLSYHFVIIAISLVILYFGQNSLTLVYIGLSTIGFGYSAMFPTFFSYADKVIKLTDRINSIFFFACTLLTMNTPFIVAPYIEQHPKVLLFLDGLLFLISVVLFITIMVIVKMSKRYPIKKT